MHLALFICTSIYHKLVFFFNFDRPPLFNGALEMGNIKKGHPYVILNISG